MIKKCLRRDGRLEVVFVVPKAYGTVSVVGDFNGWDARITPMVPNGKWQQASVVLPSGRRYRFRYVNDDGVYCNDEAADDYHPNAFGGYDCVFDLTVDGGGEPVTAP